MFSFLFLLIILTPLKCIGGVAAPADDAERPGAVQSAAFVVLHNLRHVGALPTTPYTTGEWRHGGRDADGVRGGATDQRAASAA